MHKGVNRANLSKSSSLRFSESQTPVSRSICLFLSHISIDKNAAIAIAEYIMNAGFDVYLDVYDEKLQRAVNAGDAGKITEYIEQGVENCSHMICLVSDNTVRSWWVPYELGFGKKAGKDLATLALRDVPVLPEYLAIGKILQGTPSLNRYLETLLRRNSISESLIFKSAGVAEGYLIKAATLHHPLDAYLKWQE